MKAKEYLQQVRKTDKLIENKLMEIEQWKAVAHNTTSHMYGDKVRSSNSQQKMADAVCIYADIEAERGEQIVKLQRIKDDIIHTIEQLPEKEYDILHKMYIGVVTVEKGKKITRYMNLYDIADVYDKTYSWATSIHGRALKHVQDILDMSKSV